MGGERDEVDEVDVADKGWLRKMRGIEMVHVEKILYLDRALPGVRVCQCGI